MKTIAGTTAIAGSGDVATTVSGGHYSVRIRATNDRRHRVVSPGYPLKDSGGELVSEDRRKQPDRRLYGIEPEWLEMARAMADPD